MSRSGRNPAGGEQAGPGQQLSRRQSEKPQAGADFIYIPAAQPSLYVFRLISNPACCIAQRLRGHTELLSPVSDFIVLRKVDQFSVLSAGFRLIIRVPRTTRKNLAAKRQVATSVFVWLWLAR